MIDVTRALHGRHPVWPGDPPMALEQVSAIADGDAVNVMRLTMGVHTGTHLDAPWHYDDAGARLDAVPLERLNGPCAVLRVPGGGALTAAAVLAEAERHLGGSLPPRVLLATGQPDAWDSFPRDFRPLTVELVDTLADAGVHVVGTDAPSVDALGAADLPVHAAFARRGALILEGLALAAVAVGRFELICLPLRLRGADASPVRALLRQPSRGTS